MAEETETTKDIISQISEETKKNFGFSYNVENTKKSKEYFQTTLEFLENKDYIADINSIIHKLSTKSNRFLLIDGENTFFNFDSNYEDRLIIADILKDYLEKHVFC